MSEDFDFNRIGKRMPYTAPKAELSPLVFYIRRTCGGKRSIATGFQRSAGAS